MKSIFTQPRHHRTGIHGVSRAFRCRSRCPKPASAACRCRKVMFMRVGSRTGRGDGLNECLPGGGSHRRRRRDRRARIENVDEPCARVVDRSTAFMRKVTFQGGWPWRTAVQPCPGATRRSMSQVVVDEE